LQRARGQQVHKRERVHHRDDDQTGHRKDVEGRPWQPQHVAHQHIDQARIRAEQIGERDRSEERGQQVGERRGRLDEFLARHIRATHCPGEHEADQQAEQPRPGSQDQRILQRVNVKPAR
jgi:hypothetical protein